MDIKVELERLTGLELQVVQSYNHEDDQFYVMAITGNGIKHTTRVPLRGNFKYLLNQTLETFANDITYAQTYAKAIAAQRTALNEIDRLERMQPRAVEAVKESQA
jgi:hypothetical protein